MQKIQGYAGPNLKCFFCQAYSVNSLSRICELCFADYGYLETSIAYFKGEKLMLKEHHTVEINCYSKIIVEVDPKIMNEEKVAALLKLTPEIRTVQGHLKNIVSMFLKGTRSPMPIYELVGIDGDYGGRPLSEMYEYSGVNLIPVYEDRPVIDVKKIERKRRPMNAA